MSKQFYIRCGENVQGPLGREQVEQAASSGQLQDTDEVREGETGKWLSAKAFLSEATPLGRINRHSIWTCFFWSVVGIFGLIFLLFNLIMLNMRDLSR